MFDAARHSAYAELVAALLEVRDPAADRRFDQELADAQANGRMDGETARVVRWWQRESVRAVIAHAQTVLPPTLIALERSTLELHLRTDDDPVVLQRSDDDVSNRPEVIDDEPMDRGPDLDRYRDEDEHESDAESPPTDLTARRLLVAGLTPLRDP